jgi:hypothetical protein
VTWVGLVLLALAGFLLGGMVSTWRTSRPATVVLALAAALATAAGITWMI